MDAITKKKISLSLKGRKKAARHKLAISRAMKGLKKSDQHRQNISLALLEYNYRKKMKELRG